MSDVNPYRSPLHPDRGVVASRMQRHGARPVSAAVYFSAAIAFWVPGVAVNALAPRFGVIEVAIVTVVCPLAAAGIFLSLSMLDLKASLAWKTSFYLLGIWAWGPPFMTMNGAMAAGDGYALDLARVVIMWAAFPLTAWMMAAYDGSLFALGIATAGFMVVLVLAFARNLTQDDTPDLRLRR